MLSLASRQGERPLVAKPTPLIGEFTQLVVKLCSGGQFDQGCVNLCETCNAGSLPKKPGGSRYCWSYIFDIGDFYGCSDTSQAFGPPDNFSGPWNVAIVFEKIECCDVAASGAVIHKGKTSASGDFSEIRPNMPLRLAVAASIAYPDGSMSASGLRREAAKGRLVIERTAGKDYTTLDAIERMRERCRLVSVPQGCGSVTRGNQEKESRVDLPSGSFSTADATSPQAALRARIEQHKQRLPNTSKTNIGRAAKSATLNQ
jgi:hypothetical protein